MATKREQILAYLPELLRDEVGPGVPVVRRRRRPIGKTDGLLVNIVAEGDPRQDTGGNHFTDRVLTVDFQIHARGDDPESLADDVCDALHLRLMSDRTLGGLCMDLEASDNEFEDDDA